MKKSKKSDFDYRTIKTVEDAFKKEGINPEALPDVSAILEEFRKPLLAAYKLFIVFKAINNGWIADFTNWNQFKYFPWFRVNSAGSGFDFSFSSYLCGFGRTGTAVGSRLCTDTSEKALYIAETFSDLYVDLFLNN